MSALAQSRAGGFRGALGAEWTKFRTVRGWMIGLVLAAGMVVLFTFLQANGKHTGYCTTPNPSSCVAGHQYVPTGPGGEAVADTYELVAKRLTGDGTITARITSFVGRVSAGPANEAPSLADTQPGLTSWAKAGLLVTPSTTQGSAYAAVMATGGHGVRFQYDYTHDRAGPPGSISGTAFRWLRVLGSATRSPVMTPATEPTGTGSAAFISPACQRPCTSDCSPPHRRPPKDWRPGPRPLLTTSPSAS